MPEATPVDDRPAEATEPEEPLGQIPDEPWPEDFGEPAGVTEAQVAAFWENFGTIVNRFGPTPEWAPDAWLMTPAEVQGLTIPSTEIANRNFPVIASVVAKHSAEAALGIHLIAYFKSNIARVRPPEEGEPEPAPVFPRATDFDAETGEPIEPAEPAEPGGPEVPAGDVIDDHTRPYFEQPGFGG